MPAMCVWCVFICVRAETNRKMRSHNLPQLESLEIERADGEAGEMPLPGTRARNIRGSKWSVENKANKNRPSFAASGNWSDATASRSEKLTCLAIIMEEWGNEECQEKNRRDHGRELPSHTQSLQTSVKYLYVEQKETKSHLESSWTRISFWR